MKYIKHILLLFALILIGCEGPVGPEGPAGPSGPAGPQGEQGEDGGFTFNETRRGSTDNDGLALETFSGRRLQDTIVACWVDAGEGLWAQIAYDSVNIGTGQNPDIRPNFACIGEESQGDLDVYVVGAPEQRYIIAAFGI